MIRSVIQMITDKIQMITDTQIGYVLEYFECIAKKTRFFRII